MSRKYLPAFLALGALVFLLAACTPVEFSPDGKRIVFTWSVDGKSGSLFTMNVDGTQLQSLPGGTGGLQARWSPDGKAILFGDVEQNLKAYNAETASAKTIALKTTLAFAWKEDSRQFAAVAMATNGTQELRRYLWPEGTIQSRMPLPPGVSASSFSQMAWLRGREEVAFLGTDASQHANAYVVSDAGVRKPLESSGAVGIGQTTDGKNLIWACPGSDPRNSLLKLYQYTAATGRVARLPYPARLAPINMDASRAPTTVESVIFAPHGKWMAIVVDQMPHKGSTVAQAEVSDTVYVARIDGSTAHLVQQVYATNAEDVPDVKDELIPSWSHDGKRLAVLQWGHSQTSIVLYNADGSGQKMLPLPGHVDDAVVQRIRTYVSRHYPRSLQRPSAGRR